MKYEITEDQIKELPLQLALKWFPNESKLILNQVFETKLEIGKWYKKANFGKFMFCFQGVFGNPTEEVYGFDFDGVFVRSLGVHKEDINEYIPATDSEVLEALKNEFVKQNPSVKFDEYKFANGILYVRNKHEFS